MSAEKLNALEILHKFGIELERQRLVKGDTELQALCPFHAEKTPSFHLNVEGCYYKCFGCGASGYIYDVIEELTNLSIDEIKTALRGYLPTHYKQIKPKQTRGRYLSGVEIDTLTSYAGGFHKLLTGDHKLSTSDLQGVTKWQKYLTDKRGFSWKAINHFHLGANALRDYNKRFVQESTHRSAVNAYDILHNLNLYTKHGGDYYWKPAVIIPYRSDGQTYHLNARILPEHNDPKYPKYMRMSGITRETLFNDDALDNFDELFVVEGEFNAVKLWDTGYENVVSFGGKGQLTDNVTSKFFGVDVVLYFDTDANDPEFTARQKAIDKLSEVARSVSYFQLPKGVDINDYLNTHDKQQFQDEVLSKIVHIPPEWKFSPGEYRMLTKAERKKEISLYEAQQINAKFMHLVAKNLPGYAGKRILNNMSVGTAKTTGALALLNSTKKDPALVLTSAHYLADDYDGKIDFDRLTVHLKGRSHADIECPYPDKANYLSQHGYGLYFKLNYCMSRCEKAGDCQHLQLQEAARTAPVLIATHAHGGLKDFFVSPYYGNNRRRLIIIDEEADLIREVCFGKETLKYNEKILRQASDVLTAEATADRITETELYGGLANDLAGMLKEMEAARLARTGYKPTLKPLTKNEIYRIDKAINLSVRKTGFDWMQRNALLDLVYAVNRGLEFQYQDSPADCLSYVWRAEFPKRATVIFLTGTTPKEYLEKTLDIKIDIVVGEQYYVKRENLHVTQLLKVTGGRNRLLGNKGLQEHVKEFLRLALEKHSDSRVMLITSQGANIRGDNTAKSRVIEMLQPIAEGADRNLISVETQDLEKGNVPAAMSEIPVIHYGIQGTNLFSDYDVLIELNAHYYHQKAIIDGVRRNFGTDLSEQERVKQLATFRTLDAEYQIEQHSYGVPDVDLFIQATQQADMVQAEGRILRGEDTQKTIYRLHNVNVEPYPDTVHKSWRELFENEFGYRELTGKLKDVQDWIEKNKQLGEEFTTTEITEALGGSVWDVNKRYLTTLEELGHIKNLARGKGIQTRWKRAM